MFSNSSLIEISMPETLLLTALMHSGGSGSEVCDDVQDYIEDNFGIILDLSDQEHVDYLDSLYDYFGCNGRISYIVKRSVFKQHSPSRSTMHTQLKVKIDN